MEISKKKMLCAERECKDLLRRSLCEISKNNKATRFEKLSY